MLRCYTRHSTVGRASGGDGDKLPEAACMGRDTSPEGDDSRNFCIIRATTTTANAPKHTNSWQRDVQRTPVDSSCTPRTRPLAPADTDADASLVCPPLQWRKVPFRHNSGKPRVAGPTPRFRRTLRRLASATPSRYPENFFFSAAR